MVYKKPEEHSSDEASIGSASPVSQSPSYSKPTKAKRSPGQIDVGFDSVRRKLDPLMEDEPHKTYRVLQTKIENNLLKYKLVGEPQSDEKKMLYNIFKRKLTVLGHYSEDEQREFCTGDYSLRVIRQKFGLAEGNEIPYVDTTFNDSIDTQASYPLDASTGSKGETKDKSHSENMMKDRGWVIARKIPEHEFSKDLVRFIPYIGTPRSTLINLLRWIMLNLDILSTYYTKPLASGETCFINFDFVTSKTVLAKLLELPLFPGSRAKFYAQFYENTIYIMGTELYKKQDRKVAAYSHMYKDFVSTFRRNIVHNRKRPKWHGKNKTLDANPIYRAVMHSKIGGYSILYTTSADAKRLDTNEHTSDDYMDTKDLGHEGQKPYRLPNLNDFALLRSYNKNTKASAEKHRCLFWSFDCLFSSIPRVLAAARTKGGHVEHMKMLGISSLMDTVKKHWNYETCFELLEEILKFVSEVCKRDPDNVHVFEKIRGEEMIRSRLADSSEEHSPDDFELFDDNLVNYDVSGNIDPNLQKIQVLPSFYRPPE